MRYVLKAEDRVVVWTGQSGRFFGTIVKGDGTFVQYEDDYPESCDSIGSPVSFIELWNGDMCEIVIQSTFNDRTDNSDSIYLDGQGHALRAESTSVFGTLTNPLTSLQNR